MEHNRTYPMALPEPSKRKTEKKPKIKTYSIQGIYAGCTQCDGELVNQDGSFLLSIYHDEIIQCQDCWTEHKFPTQIRKVRGPHHSAF